MCSEIQLLSTVQSLSCEQNLQAKHFHPKAMETFHLRMSRRLLRKRLQTTNYIVPRLCQWFLELWHMVVDFDMSVYEVYCHFDADGAWTLVQSHNIANGSADYRHQTALYRNFPISENAVNWRGYRLRRPRMRSIQNNSAFLRLTCDYEKYHDDINETDYLQILLANIKISGRGVVDVLDLDGETSHLTAGKWPTSYPGSLCLISCTREGPWQTLIARLPNNPKILDYLVTWPCSAIAYRGTEIKNHKLIQAEFFYSRLKQSVRLKVSCLKRFNLHALFKF